MNSHTVSGTQKPGNIVLFHNEVHTSIVPGVHTIGGQGNSLAIETSKGVVIVDAGPGGKITVNMIENLRRITDATVYAIIYSHGHNGYNSGVGVWKEHARTRKENPPILISHERVPLRYARYLETAGLQNWLNGRQFRREFKPYTADAFPLPDITFGEHLTLDCGDRKIELVHSPSETDDSISVWLPEERFLYAGPAVIRSIPNIGTPLRTFRDPVRWGQSLEKLYALNPRIVMPEFGAPIIDADEVRDAFLVPLKALRYLRKEVVDRMNEGMNERAILASMTYPDDMFGHKFMRSIYGCPEYIVREIWRSENGWWDRNPTTLHPAPPKAAAAAILTALGDPAVIVKHAESLRDEGKVQLALHVIDILANAESDHPQVAEARKLKAELCVSRAKEMTSIVSRNILLSSAEDLLGLPIGANRALDPEFEFSWN